MVTQDALDLIFNNARTHVAWQDKPVDDALLQRVYDLAKMGPTSMNCSPLRLVFVKSAAAKEKLKPCLMGGNVDKTMTAPVTVIFAQDMEFYTQMDKLWPHGGGKMFVGHEALTTSTAVRNATLQAAYFMLAARLLGLDCGPMSGFDNAAVDAAFFAGTAFKSNFLCNLGYGDASKLYPRGPRLSFDEVAKII
ncbi:MAG: malonic semialdehyde reductase [Alphaproteobacteria bacterium]|nr:malonic semialdehyde reductase [Alphaproteobacteria bacterium]